MLAGAQDVIAGKTRHIHGIQVLGRYSVRFILARPVAVFPYILAQSFNFVVPKAVVTREAPDYLVSHAAGTGPFTIAAYHKGVQVGGLGAQSALPPQMPDLSTATIRGGHAV